MTVISMPVKEVQKDEIWVCGCGCSSFGLRMDGEFECKGCDCIIDAPSGNWWDRIKHGGKSDGLSPPEDEVCGNGSEFVELRTKEMAAHQDVSFLIFGDDDGRVTSWFRNEGESDELNAWFKRQVTKALEMIK